MHTLETPINLISSFKNEEVAGPIFIENLLSTLDSKEIVYKLILVDDGSTDSTTSHLMKFTDRNNVELLTLSQNIGKIGAHAVGALKFKDINSDLIFFDGDGQHHAQEILKVIEHGKKNSSIAVGTRTDQYKRRIFSKVGTFLLTKIFKVLGIDISLQNSELIYFPAKQVASLLADANFGYLPLNLLTTNKKVLQVPIQIYPRINSNTNEVETRHNFGELVRKALIQIYSQPLKMLYRITVIGLIPALGVFFYGIYVGIVSLSKGDPSGAGSIIVILTFSTLLILALGIVSFGFLIVTNEWHRSRNLLESELK
jgi:glycosyltransferase involved in cell wall biosynthesis